MDGTDTNTDLRVETRLNTDTQLLWVSVYI